MPSGDGLLDLGRLFVERSCAPAGLAASIASLQGEGPDAAMALLQAQAAAALLGRAELPAHPRLRAIGAALTAASQAPSGVRLRLDDLELASGSTERLADCLAASRAPSPYARELEEALGATAGASELVLWLERDQQVPAALALGELLRGAGGAPLRVCGPFAQTHQAALAQAPPFSGAAFGPPASGLPTPTVTLRLSEGEVPVRHRQDHEAPPKEGPWAGWVWPSELEDPARLLRCGLRVATLGFTQLGPDLFRDVRGARHGLGWIRERCERLREAGVPVVAEWWVGAPGLGAGEHEETAGVLLGSPPWDWLAGLRRFHWSEQRASKGFGELAVEVGAAPGDRDLARSVPVSAPGSLAPQALAELEQALARRLLAHRPLAPGRLAGAYAPPPAAPPLTGRLRLDPDCAVVALATTLDGRPVPTHYAANLRTGGVMAIDGRLAPRLSVAFAPATAEELLSLAPPAQRARLATALCQRGVLEEV